MSKSKGFSDTSVGRYSLALYELAEESNATHEIEKDSLSIIQLISNSEDFNLLIKDPTNKKQDQLNVILKISEKFKINNLLTKFLSFLIYKRRFFYVEKILKDFIETCSKKRGEMMNYISNKKIFVTFSFNLMDFLKK